MKHLLVLVIFVSGLIAAPTKGVKNKPLHTTVNLLHGFSEVVQTVLPSVINISIIQNTKDDKSNRESLGSGVIFDADGYIVTNNHVIEDAEDINVTLFDGTELKAQVIGQDAKYDIAVLKVKIPESVKLKAAKWGDSDKVKVGHWAIAIGNPEGFGNTVTHGIISNISRDLSSRIRDIGGNDLVDYIQTDASINTGNSGGPLFNANGEVIGIVTVIVSETGSNVGLNFAMPSNSVKEVVSQLKKFGKMHRGWIGVQLEELGHDVSESLGLKTINGSVVVKVVQNSPAFNAGIRPGDIIVKINGIDTFKTKTISRIISELSVGSRVNIEVLRNMKSMNFIVEVGVSQDEDYQDVPSYSINSNNSGLLIHTLNIVVDDISDKMVKIFDIPDNMKGTMIVKIMKGSTLESVDVRNGDIILKVNNTPVDNKEHFDKLIVKEEARSSKKAALLIWREGDFLYRSVTLMTNKTH